MTQTTTGTDTLAGRGAAEAGGTGARGMAAALAACLLVVAAGPAQASKCEGAKLKAVGKAASCRLVLQSKRAKTGLPIDSAKAAACDAKLAADFGKAETKPPCSTTGDAAALTLLTNIFVATAEFQLAVALPNACQAGKLKAAAKKTKCLLGLEAKEATTGVPVDSAKAAQCRARFDAAFAALEAKGGCSTTGDAAAVETTVDDFVAWTDATLTCRAGTTPVGGFCWTAGLPGESCDQACALVGSSYDDATRTFAGSGGTNLACRQVLDALGLGAPLGAVGDIACGPVGGGLGCAFDAPYRSRCVSPATTSWNTFGGIQRACACLRTGTTTTVTTTSTTTTTLPPEVCCLTAFFAPACVAASSAAACPAGSTVGTGVCRNDGQCGAPTGPGPCCDDGGQCLVAQGGATLAVCNGLGGTYWSSATCTPLGCQ